MILGSVRIGKCDLGSVSHNLKYTKDKLNDYENKLYTFKNGVVDNGSSFKRNIEDKESEGFKLWNDRIKNIKKEHSEEIKKCREDFQKHNKSGKKLRSDSNLFYGGIVTFGNFESNLTREDLEKEGIEKLTENVKKSLLDYEKKYKVKMTNLYLHNDESQIHYHFEFIAYNYETHKPHKTDLSPMELSKIQTNFFGNFDNVSRGVKKSQRINEQLKVMGLKREEMDTMTPEQRKELYESSNVKNDLKGVKSELPKQVEKMKLEQKEEEFILLRMKEEIKTERSNLMSLNKSVKERNLQYRKLKTITTEMTKDQKEIQNYIKENSKSQKSINEMIKSSKSFGMIDNKKLNVLVDRYMKEENKELFKSLVEKNKTITQLEKKVSRLPSGAGVSIGGLNQNFNNLDREYQNLKIENTKDKEKLKDYESFMNNPKVQGLYMEMENKKKRDMGYKSHNVSGNNVEM